MAIARGLSTLTLIVAVGLSAPVAVARQPAPAAPTSAQVEQELVQLPHPALMEAVDATVGGKAPASLKLSKAKAQDVKAAHEAFERQVREFIRTHASGSGGDPSATIPSRSEAEAKILAMLRPDQRAAVEAKLREAATRRVTDRQSSHASDHHSTEYRSPDGHTVSKSESSSETSSSRESSSQSNSDHHADHHSSSSKDSKSAHDSNSSKDSKSSSGQQGAGKDSKQSSQAQSTSAQTKAWTAQNADERRATIRSLLDQLPDADRAALQKELKIAPPPR